MYHKQFFVDEERYGPATLERHDSAGGRTYTHQNAEYPSVTTILAELPDDEWLRRWKERTSVEDQEKARRKATRQGSRVHELVERYVRHENVVFASANPQEVSLVGPLLAEVSKMHTIFGIEYPLVSERLKYAGTCDLWGRRTGAFEVIDLKTSRYLPYEGHAPEKYCLQLALYAMAIAEMHEITINDGRILMSSTYDGMQVFDIDLKDYFEKACEAVSDYHARRC